MVYISELVLICAILGPILALIVFMCLKAGIGSTSEVSKKRLALHKAYARELEEEIAALKVDLRSAKAKYSNREQAPMITGDISDIASVIPSLLPTLEHKLPRWLRPLLHNEQVMNSITTYAKENPEDLKRLVGSLVNLKPSSDKAKIEETLTV